MAPIAPLKIIVAPAAKAIAKIGSTMTYDDVPCIVDERNDSCPYLGHVPYFAPHIAPRPQCRQSRRWRVWKTQIVRGFGSTARDSKPELLPS